jgi:glycosyltransferase involved in cell wall biosynthesis
MNGDLPLVSIVTPVYNGEKYLAECIESVLNQKYTNWEYIIANNCSTDSSLDIARGYAKLDDRVHVYSYEEFVGVIQSHNRALRAISPSSKYCKIVSADDWIFPECVNSMVDLAEHNPAVGIVGAYVLSGGGTEWRLKLDGLPYHKSIIPGREACRWHLLGDRHYLGFPTAVLYRSDLVRREKSFYPNLREHADISAFYKYLQNSDFGFIHQVLAYERIHRENLSAEALKIYSIEGSKLLDVLEYGPLYLSKEEMTARLKGLTRDYYDLLAIGIVNLKGKRFWNYHMQILRESGQPLSVIKLGTAIFRKMFDLAFNPKQTVEKILRRLKNR